MKAEPAAGVWGRRIAQVSEPAVTHPGWLPIEKMVQFCRGRSQPPVVRICNHSDLAGTRVGSANPAILKPMHGRPI
jgi:hypothetical protein